MALGHAQRVAATVERVTTDPVGFVVELEDWVGASFGGWYHAQVAADAGRRRQLESALAGRQWCSPPGSAERVFAGLSDLQDDPVVGPVREACFNLLAPPAAMTVDRQVMRRVLRAARSRPAVSAPGPSRPPSSDS